MSWLSLEDGRNLKLFTTILLEDSRTLLFQNIQNAEKNLNWVTLERDAQVFATCFRVLWDSRDLNDELFEADILPHLEVFLIKSEIFTELKNPDIQVTAGHNKLRPYSHVINVLRSLVTDGLNDVQVFLLRAGALYHDLGKMVSAGIPEEEVVKMMETYFNRSHSFPNHDLLSVMILERLASHPQIQEFITKIGSENWELLLLIIHNHHIFEFKIKPEEKIDELADLQQQMPDILKDPFDLEALLLTFCLAFADLNSTPSYQKYWPEKIAHLEKLLTDLEGSLPLTSFIFANLQSAHAVPEALLTAPTS